MADQTRKLDPNANLNEYIFARVVEDYNEQAARSDGQKPLITATRGRTLHSELLKKLDRKVNSKTQQSYSMSNTPKGMLFNTINETFQSVLGEDIVPRDAYDDRFKGYLSDYLESMHWSLDPQAVEDRKKRGIVPEGGYLPISPFDERFSHRSTILNHGTEILYAHADSFIEFVPNENGTGYDMAYRHDPEDEVNEEFVSMYKDNYDRPRYRDAGPAYTEDDMFGVSRIRPYISESDYKAIAGHMHINKEQRMSPEAMDRSVSILQWLQENGVPYSVSRDRRPGQLKVDIGNTKVSIRLTENRDNERFIGRVYKDGYAMYLNARRLSKEEYIPTMEETKILVQYAIGFHPDRRNNRSRNVGAKVGSPGTMGAGIRSDRPASRISFMKMSPETHAPTLQTMVGFTDAASGEKPKLLNLMTTNNHSDAHRYFETEEDAAQFLQDAVNSARQNFANEINLDYLIQEAKEHADKEDYVPILSGDTSIAPVQRIYWDVLTGKSELYRPESATENSALRPIFEALGLLEEDTEEEPDVDTLKLDSGRELYSGTPEEQVRAHLKDSIDLMFGHYNPDVNGKRFCPSFVSGFMDSSFGVYRNNDNLVAAMYKLGFDGDELIGDDFQTGLLKDRLLRFDPTTAEPMMNKQSPFMKAIFNTIRSSIEETACEVKPEDILIDAYGVVHYKAYQLVGSSVNNENIKQFYVQGKDGKTRSVSGRLPIEGEIGQIFEPDMQGVIETYYNGSENKLFTPGYDAYIVPETGENAGKDMMERVRLRGLLQIMQQNITETIRYDLISNGEMIRDENGALLGKSIGTTTSVNNTYRGLYGTSYKVSIEREPGESLKDAYVRQASMTHLPKEILDARFETAKGLLHFSKDVAEDSTVAAEFFHNMKSKTGTSVYDLTNDNHLDAYTLTGGSNMAITQNHSQGYTDPVMTGSGKNQGIVRYLAEGTEVTPDGRIIPSKDEHARTRLMNTTPMRYKDYTPADRGMMVSSNLMTASGVAGMEEGVGMAQLTLQGFTFDDGAVISSDFAHKYGVVGEDGEIRDLGVGDKICDFAGNKSIIVKVIDRNMDLETAREKGIETAVELFKKNPKLDVVQAPYSAVSRFNAASARLLMEHDKEDLVLPDGSVHEGCIGFAPVIITHHTAHEHTKQYDDDAVQSGRGRKVSAQLAWALSAVDAKCIMDEVFSGNNSAVSNLREMLNVMGLDMDETGTLRVGYQPHTNEERYLFKLPSYEEIESMEPDKIGESFKDVVDSRGGFLEIPFPIKLPSGEMTEEVDPAQSNYPDHKMYKLPVLSSHMRSGQTFADGTSQTHDYTNQYVRIFKSAIDYLEAEKANNVNKCIQARSQAETAYTAITESIRMRKFDTKHNVMRDDLMSHRMPHSATAVWTPDSNLAINEIAMNSSMMRNLGVKEGEYALIWRDPILRRYGAKYMKVVKDDELTGVAVNPLMAVSMDGDFDGDSVGMIGFSREDSKEEAIRKFSFEYNILDVTKRRENGDFALMINDSMDVISAEYLDEKRKDVAVREGKEYGPTLKERRMELEHKANELYKTGAGFEERSSFIKELSDWAKDCLCHTCGTEVVSYKDVKSHAQSLVDVVDHGAKGNHKKLGYYFKYFGAEFERDADGRILPNTMKDIGHTLATEDDIANTELATAIKSHGTGNAGAVSQRFVMFARNRGIVIGKDAENGLKENALSAGLYLTYLSTQGILQAKHDPVQAKRLYEMVQMPIRNLWRGRAMECVDVTDPITGTTTRQWSPVKQTDAEGNTVYVQATKEEWIKAFMDIHTHKDGLDLAGCINEDHVRQVADALFDEKTGRMFDIEDEKTVYDNAPVMDVLAYRTKDAFETLCKFARDGRNVFEGEYNQMFAPKQIRENQLAKQEGREMSAVVSKDVMADYDPKKKGHAAFQVETVGKDYAETERALVDMEQHNEAFFTKGDITIDDDNALTEQMNQTADQKKGFDFSAKAQSEAKQESAVNRVKELEQTVVHAGVSAECPSL